MKDLIEDVLLKDAPYEEAVGSLIERLLQAQGKAPAGADVYVKFEICSGNYDDYVGMTLAYLREPTDAELAEDAERQKYMDRRQYAHFLELQEKFKDGAP